MRVQLSSPIKRTALVAFIAGLVLLVIGYLLIEPNSTWYNLMHLDFRNVVGQVYSRENPIGRVMVWAGLALTISGALVAFTRLEEWIRHGGKQ